MTLRSARAAVVLFLLAALLTSSCHHRSDLPRLFPVPNAELIADTGRAVKLDEMKGFVTVYDFIFTNCAGSCPIMTSMMRTITTKISKGAKVRFVSISVDGERDTPQVLASYARKVRNDERWIFLTGAKSVVTRLSIDGFKLAAGGVATTTAEPLLHSAKFAIADKWGVIREYADAGDAGAAAHVASTVEELLRED